MNLSAIILIIIAIYLIRKINSRDQLGGGVKQINITNKTNDPYYSRQYRELDNVDNVLLRPIDKSNKDIENLISSNTFTHSDQEIRVPIKKYLDFVDTKTRKTPEDTKVIIEHKKPYFLDESLIIDYYGEKYYWDERFPKQPISIDFAKDPIKYVKDHPNEYPSYIVASRNLSDLSPNTVEFYEN